MKQIFFQTALILMLSSISLTAEAQEFNHYQPILCKGNLPKEITTPSAVKYQLEMRRESQEQKQSDQKAKEKFLLSQRYFTDDLLKSGKIIVNPELIDYLNEILDILLKDEPEVRSKIHLYILRSPSVNALAMNDGTILICWGLLAQLENEAQLAYVLSHEITHFKERHVLDEFKERNKRNRKEITSEGENQDDAYQEAAVAKYSYAKRLESEADSQGLIRFLKTPYSTSAPEEAFNKLKYSYLSFLDLPFDEQIFSLDSVIIPKKYFLDEINKTKGDDEYKDDKFSSHPNWGKRRAAIQNAMKGIEARGSSFLVSSEKFMQLQNIARFELPQAYLHCQLFEESFYNAYLLLQNNPNNYYLQSIIAKSLNGLVKERHNWARKYHLKNEAKYFNKVEGAGEMQQVNYLFKTLKYDELNLLALNYAWKFHQRFKDEPETKVIVEELFQELVEHHYDSAKDLRLTAEERATKEEYWARVALSTHLTDTAFLNYFEVCQKVKQENAEWLKKYQNETFASLQRQQEKKGARLGIDKIVVVNPRYFYESTIKTNDLGFFATEKGNNHLKKVITDVAGKAKIDMQLLSLANIKPEDTDKFNEVTLLTEWVSEQINTDGLGIGSQQTRINEIAKKYDTRYFLWLNVVEVKIKQDFNSMGRAFLATIATPFFFPKVASEIFMPKYVTAVYATLYDVKTGKNYPLKRKEFKKKASDMILYSQFYDAFSQIKYHKK